MTGRPMAADSRRISRPPWPGADDLAGQPSGASSKPRCPARPGRRRCRTARPRPRRSRDGLAVDGQVGDGARGREAQRTGPTASTTGPHLGDVVGRGRLVAGAPLAHDIGPHRAVGDLGADVEGPAAPIQGVEVVGEGLPVPVMPSARAVPGMSSTPSMSPMSQSWRSGRAGAKPTPQLPMTTGSRRARRRGQHVVPGGLAVVVGVDVDPARRDQRAVGVDDAGAPPDGRPPR